MHRLLGLILFLSVASCNADFGPSGRYEKWLDTGPKSYEMIVSRTCTACSSDMMGPVHVVVREGSGVRRTYVSSGLAVPNGLDDMFPTVNELFYMVDLLKADKRYKLNVQYDEELEIPVALDIETFDHGAEVKIGIYVTEFHAN